MMTRLRAFAALLAVLLVASSAQAQQVIADLSRHLVAITTGFLLLCLATWRPAPDLE